MSTVQIFGKDKCFNTRKAQRYFKERGINFQYVDIMQKNLSRGEFRSVAASIDSFDVILNESSPNAALVKYLLYEDIEEKFLTDPTLFKTPIVRFGRKVTVGYCPEEWGEWELK